LCTNEADLSRMLLVGGDPTTTQLALDQILLDEGTMAMSMAKAMGAVDYHGAESELK
jgi:hypothetical protein